jgi:hypothetical protein
VDNGDEEVVCDTGDEEYREDKRDDKSGDADENVNDSDGETL